MDRQTADQAVGFIEGPSGNGEYNGDAAEIAEKPKAPRKKKATKK